MSEAEKKLLEYATPAQPRQQSWYAESWTLREVLGCLAMLMLAIAGIVGLAWIGLMYIGSLDWWSSGIG
ncbi:MAG: hypothetical protein H7Z14_06765 [Anaerolineae bacterium]|nr:hypothetical protein [Phycisphaerae bacterium]